MPLRLRIKQIDNYTPDEVTYNALDALAQNNSLNLHTNKVLNNKYQYREVGVIHPDTGSHIRLRDNGNIDMFASNGCGMRVNRDDEAIMIAASDLLLNTKNLDIKTEHTGFKLNGYILNPNLYLFNNGQYVKNLKLKAIVDVYDAATGDFVTTDTEIKPFVTQARDIGYYDKNSLKLILDK
jgi:hypothetical protein